MRFRITAFALVLMLILFAAGNAGAQEWTRFRGPNGSGVNDAISIPAVWTDKDYRWKITLPGGGHSSPVLWGDRLFITCADDATASRTLLGVNAADGKTLWHAEFSSHVFHQHQDNSYASSTPTVDANGIYLCWNTPEEFTIYGFDHDGKQLWKTDLGAVRQPARRRQLADRRRRCGASSATINEGNAIELCSLASIAPPAKSSGKLKRNSDKVLRQSTPVVLHARFRRIRIWQCSLVTAKA
jgi:outer membrane protein assembly factor BamB